MMEEDFERDLNEKTWDLKDSRAFVHIAQFISISSNLEAAVGDGDRIFVQSKLSIATECFAANQASCEHDGSIGSR